MSLEKSSNKKGGDKRRSTINARKSLKRNVTKNFHVNMKDLSSVYAEKKRLALKL